MKDSLHFKVIWYNAYLPYKSFIEEKDYLVEDLKNLYLLSEFELDFLDN